MVSIISWDQGDTIRINNSFTDIDSDEVYDPTTISLSIYDPKGVVIKTVTYAAAEIIRSEKGVYYYDYDIADDALTGSYISKWIGVASGFNDVSKDQFSVCNPDKKLYCTVEEVWNRAGIDSNVATRNEVIPLIKDSMAEIDAMYAKSFQYGIEKTEWYDTNRADPAIKVINVYLNYKPVISITSFEEYDTDGNLIKTYDAADYWLNTNTGRITLLDTEFVKQIHRVKVVYTYGFVEIPQNISSLCAILSAMRLLVHQIGMQYDDVTSWSAAGLSVGVGEPYTSMARALEFLTKESTRLISSIGRMRPSAMVL
jgi:hypothetical protein